MLPPPKISELRDFRHEFLYNSSETADNFDLKDGLWSSMVCTTVLTILIKHNIPKLNKKKIIFVGTWLNFSTTKRFYTSPAHDVCDI